jgi:hypothetical protein
VPVLITIAASLAGCGSGDGGASDSSVIAGEPSVASDLPSAIPQAGPVADPALVGRMMTEALFANPDAIMALAAGLDAGQRQAAIACLRRVRDAANSGLAAFGDIQRQVNDRMQLEMPGSARELGGSGLLGPALDSEIALTVLETPGALADNGSFAMRRQWWSAVQTSGDALAQMMPGSGFDTARFMADQRPMFEQSYRDMAAAACPA